MFKHRTQREERECLNAEHSGEERGMFKRRTQRGGKGNVYTQNTAGK